jgi:hypothetical protein
VIPIPLQGLRVALLLSPRLVKQVAWALQSRGAVTDRVLTVTAALDALLHGRHHVLVTDCLVPGVLLVMQPRHLLASPREGCFRDDLVELVDTPVDPAVLADAVRGAAWRSGVGGTVLPLAGSGLEAA